MATINERNGRYQITVSCGYDINGKHIRETITFTPDPTLTPKKKKKAVEDFAAEFERKVRNGLVMDGRKITLKEFTERWLQEYAPQNLEAHTLESYKTELEDKILPAIGHYKLSALRPHVLNSFFTDMTKDGARKDGKPGGYSKGTIAKTRTVLSSVLRTATEWELLDSNPLSKVRYKAEDAADKIEFFTPEQASIFLDYIEKPYTIKTKGHKRIDDTGKEYVVADYHRRNEIPEQIRVLFNLAIFGGLRKGELLALKWQDVDFENDTVSISKSVTLVAGKQTLKLPKTKKSHRVVTIPHFLIGRLQKLRKDQIAYRLSLGDYWQGENWIFTQENGKQMSYYTPYTALQDTLIRYNEGKPADKQLPVIPFHGLRHTSATLLITNRQDVRTVAARLGHAKTSTTMNIYAHSFQEMDRRAVDTLETVLKKKA